MPSSRPSSRRVRAAPPALPAYTVPFPLSSVAAVVRFLAGIEDRLCGVAATAVGATSTAAASAAGGRRPQRGGGPRHPAKALGGAAPGEAVTPLPGLPGR